MSRKAASRRIAQLLRDYRGSAKDVMTDADYPPDDPHNIPGVYFIVEYRDWGHGREPDRVKIGKSDDPRLRLANLRTGNSAELDLEHVIYEPDNGRRRALEAELQHRFLHLRVAREWFRWTDELSDYVSTLCREQCWERRYL
ncbi:GIY-YIG nuclease family protein [Catellatospora sp. TT07R-123]|uniref:GIY-YIG nuclease family protein n=1 Tax=Catellatospora sp. TT07R-123 TaxID=2733863 RepID=UPI001BB2FA9B|nr:GIY-YIG nuclease family protein [Catellatospora sp. TT07R-123]